MLLNSRLSITSITSIKIDYVIMLNFLYTASLVPSLVSSQLMEFTFSNPFKSLLMSVMAEGVKLHACYLEIVNDQDKEAAYNTMNHEIWGEGMKWLENSW